MIRSHNNKLLICALITFSCIGFDSTTTPSFAETETQSLLPIYTPSDQQAGNAWGVIEIMKCPDGTELIMSEASLSLHNVSTPHCILLKDIEKQDGKP